MSFSLTLKLFFLRRRENDRVVETLFFFTTCSHEDDDEVRNNKKDTFKNKVEVDYNHNRHQYKNSECGVYSMNFIIRLLNGESFKNITENKTLDDPMNRCRDKYFTLSKPYDKL